MAVTDYPSVQAGVQLFRLQENRRAAGTPTDGIGHLKNEKFLSMYSSSHNPASLGYLSLLDHFCHGILSVMDTVHESTEAAILNRVFRPNAEAWPRAAAEAILSISFDPSDRDRMTLLLERAKTGELSSEDAEALENYRHIGRLLELMKSRARQSLQTAATS